MKKVILEIELPEEWDDTIHIFRIDAIDTDEGCLAFDTLPYKIIESQVEQETCKWVDSISNPKYSVSTCENIALPIKELYKYGVKFCPFCGLKIERI